MNMNELNNVITRINIVWKRPISPLFSSRDYGLSKIENNAIKQKYDVTRIPGIR